MLVFIARPFVFATADVPGGIGMDVWFTRQEKRAFGVAV